jgi:hypothetical protein
LAYGQMHAINVTLHVQFQVVLSLLPLYAEDYLSVM